MINPLLLILTGIQKPLQRTWRWEKGWRFLRPICPRHFQVKNLISLIWLLWKNECWVLLTCRNYIAHLNIVKSSCHLRGRLKMSKFQISYIFVIKILGRLTQTRTIAWASKNGKWASISWSCSRRLFLLDFDVLTTSHISDKMLPISWRSLSDLSIWVMRRKSRIKTWAKSTRRISCLLWRCVHVYEEKIIMFLAC